MSDEQIKKDIVGLWMMVEAYGQANVVHYDNKGIATLHLFICDSENENFQYKGYDRYNYKIENGSVVMKHLDRDFTSKQTVSELGSLFMKMKYDMPEHSFDKIELSYVNAKEIRPICTYMVNNFFNRKKNESLSETP